MKETEIELRVQEEQRHLSFVQRVQDSEEVKESPGKVWREDQRSGHGMSCAFPDVEVPQNV